MDWENASGTSKTDGSGSKLAMLRGISDLQLSHASMSGWVSPSPSSFAHCWTLECLNPWSLPSAQKNYKLEKQAMEEQQGLLWQENGLNTFVLELGGKFKKVHVGRHLSSCE